MAAGFAGSVVIGVIMGLVSFLKIPKMKITLNEDNLEVEKGSAKGTYLLEDFIGCRKQVNMSGRRYKTTFSLVFEDEDGEELFIDCLGFNYYKILGLADAIRVRIHDSSEDNVDTLSNDRYEGAEGESEELLSIGKLYLFLIIAFLIGLGFAGFVVYRRGFPSAIPFVICAGTIAVIMIVLIIKLIKISYTDTEQEVKEIALDSFGIKVNDRTYDYVKIKDIYITPPYLTRFDDDDARSLVIGDSGSEKPVVYTVGRRPKEYDPSGEYTKLYNSIKAVCDSKGIRMELYRMPEKT